jgi:hypothetical protein
MDRVKLPIDLRAVVDVPIPQESETVAADLVRLRHYIFGIVRESFSKQADALWKFIR